MIPEAAITHWRNVVSWSQDVQVEQDLILSPGIRYNAATAARVVREKLLALL